MFKGIPIQHCEHLPKGTAYMWAEPTEREKAEYRVDALLYGADEAKDRIMRKLAPRCLVIHNMEAPDDED